MQTNELNERKFRSLPGRETTSISGEIVSTGTCVPFWGMVWYEGLFCASLQWSLWAY